MPITAMVLYRDSFSFFKSHLNNILLLSLLTSCISILLHHLLGGDSEILKTFFTEKNNFDVSVTVNVRELILQMTPEQKIILLKASVVEALSSLVSNSILIGGLLTLLSLVSRGENTSALRAIFSSIPELPRLIVLLFICSLMIQVGLSLLIIPGIIMMIAFSMASIISTTDKKGVFVSIQLSCRIAISNSHLILPALAIWMITKLLLLFLFSHLSLLTPNAAQFALNTTVNLISSLLLIYLFRLYMLLSNELTTNNKEYYL